MKNSRITSPLVKTMLREFNRIGQRKTIYFLTIVLPIVLFLLLALIYKNSVIRELPVVIYDADHSEISRMLTRAVDATASMRIYKYVNSVSEIKDEFLKGHIQGAFYFPHGLESELKSGKKSNVVIFKNTSNLIIGNMIYKDAMTLIRTYSGGILLKKLRSQGIGEQKAMGIVNPIRLDTHALYNPNYNYLSYLIPGLFTALLQMIIMVSGVLVISSEFTHNTFGELLTVSGNNILILLTGKSIPHILMHLATVTGLIGIIFPLFSIEITGSVILTFLFLMLFILASFFPSMLISSIFHEQLFATEVAIFINTPAFIFSGFTFPLWGMSVVHNCFAQIIPFTHFMTGFLKLYQMNVPVSYIVPEAVVLSLFVIISFSGTLWVLSFKAKDYRKALTSRRGETL